LTLTKRKYNIGVLGAGSWGIALALVLEKNGHHVTLWEFRSEAAERLRRTRDAKEFLPGIMIPFNVDIVNDFRQACNSKDVIVVAVPSHVVRSVAERLNRLSFEILPILVNVAKGVENDTLMRMSEVLNQTVNWANIDNIVTLSGPSHAEEVSRQIPTAIVSASENLQTAEIIQQIFMNQFFRV